MKALDQLKELDFNHRRERYPSAPAHAIVRGKFSDTTANGLTKCIIRFLQLKGHKAWRQGSEGRYRPGKQYSDVIGRTRLMRGQYLPGLNKGHADVCCILNGRFLALEVKMKDKQTPAQKEYQHEVEASGGLYAIVRSFEEFMSFYNQTLNNETRK